MEQGQVILSYACASLAFLLCFLFIRLCHDLLLRPKMLRLKLQKQGIAGPKPSLLVGNTPEIKQMTSMFSLSEASIINNWKEPTPVLDCSSILFPHFKLWTKQYGKTLSFSLGNIQLLYVADPNLVREINLCKSLDLGKPAYLRKQRGPLLGKGLLTTNYGVWSHHRKIIAPQFYMDKVKGMLNIVVESAAELVKSWERMVDNEAGIAEISVDEYVRSFTSDVFSRIMFGSNYSIGAELLPRCRDLFKATASPAMLDGLPFSWIYPTKKNRDAWRLKKEIFSIIIDTAKKCNRNAAEELIQVLLEAGKHVELGPSTSYDQFVADNCKALYLAAYEAVGTSILWGLTLLASHPEWQDKARAEALEMICGADRLDADKLSKMKVLKMVILETLRLYPTAAVVQREALQDVKLGNLCIPKGVNIWIWVLALHRDTELWGPDADKFNPERFANGISGACKHPQAYAPFGLGPRICPGQHLAMLEMKVIFALILSKFSFSLSPNYRHRPHYGLLLEPKYEVTLLVRQI